MICWHEEIPFDFSDQITDQIFTEQSIFFDIETTGFSPARSSLYLIGCATRKGNLLNVDQFFAKSADEEKEIILAFFSLLAQYQTIITFNGIGFDIPYLKAKCNKFQIPPPFDTYLYVDIYKEVAKQKALLGLASLKQKSIEIFLGIDRKDTFSGGELIEVYHAYTKTPTKEALSLLRQHNYEDVIYMPKLLPILAYRTILTNNIVVTALEANESRTFDGTIQKELIFTLSGFFHVPKPLSYHDRDCYIAFSKTDIRLCVKLYDEELRFYFPNPKEYYYLPLEDCAIHKSLASGVDRTHRKQATASNCYVRKHAIFLPQYEDLFAPVFRRTPHEHTCYFELTEDFISSSTLQERYVRHLLSYINTKKSRD